jgi:multiple antibiotic resistance protein
MNWGGFRHFEEVFVPMFVALSPLSVLPIYLGMTEQLDTGATRAITRKAIVTAFTVAIIITLGGQYIFRALSISVNDLRVGGGLIMLILAIYDLLFSREQRKLKEVDLSTDVGVVPLGTPLIVGPATMTACLVLVDTHGRTLVFAALILNLVLIWLMLHYSGFVTIYVNPAVSRAFGKVMSLMMAAIAVGTMRVGIVSFIASYTPKAPQPAAAPAATPGSDLSGN